MSAPPKIEPSALTEAVEAMEAAIGAGDWEGAARFFTDDVLYKVAHREPAYGLAGIKAYMAWQSERVRWTGHTPRMKFSRGDTAVFEVESHFLRLRDSAALIVPCTDIYTFRDGRIADWRVYADTSPFDAPA
ncbi:MAG: nuclear transport factor 2 family protein [Pseudomonadota bacterium]